MNAAITHAVSRARLLVTCAIVGAIIVAVPAIADDASVASPSYVNAATASTGASSTSLTLARPAGVQAGDLLVAAFSARSGLETSITNPAGWTQIRRDLCEGPQQTTLTQPLLYRVATGAEPLAYTWSFGRSVSAAGEVVAFRGASGTVLAHSGRYTR